MSGQLEIVHITDNGKNIDGHKITNVKTKVSDVLDLYNKNKPLFIDFYANWCGHCKTLAPEWEKLITNIKKENTDVALVSIEADALKKEEDLIKMMKELNLEVSGFPTIGAVINKKFTSYEGERNAEAMLDYIKTKVLHKKQGGGGRKRSSKKSTRRTKKSTRRSRSKRSRKSKRSSKK